jgi:hypothetical protein
MFVVNLLKHYFELLFNKVDFSLEQSYRKSEEKLFGSAKQDVSLKAIDEILKSKK